jgi:hypothetical protein
VQAECCICYAALQVEFERPVDAKGNIEVWLQRLVDGMQDTVKQVSRRCTLACSAVHWQECCKLS